jgi:phosphoribosylaminoimidazolecarboxamide formyltransferase/IMP cyclohydrolase
MPRRWPPCRSGGFTFAAAAALAAEAFAHTAAYDVAVASWMGSGAYADTSRRDRLPGLRGGDLDAGRGAALRREPAPAGRALSQWRAARHRLGDQLHGKEMSYNNYVDADAALRACRDHGDQPTCAIIKHANPCGIAVGRGGRHRPGAPRAHACDPVSAFGGVIAVNRPVTLEMAQTVKDIFTEVVVAPGFDDDAWRC